MDDRIMGEIWIDGETGYLHYWSDGANTAIIMPENMSCVGCVSHHNIDWYAVGDTIYFEQTPTYDEIYAFELADKL